MSMKTDKPESQYFGTFLRFKDMKKVLDDRNITLPEKMQVVGTTIGVVAAFFGMILMIATGVPIQAIIIAGVLVVGTPIISVILQRTLHVRMGISHVIAVYTMFTIPVFWFYSGGITAGGTLWMVFYVLFLAAVFHGKTLTIYLIATMVLYIASFVLGKVHAEWITVLPSMDQMYINTFVSMVIVSVAMTVVIVVQKRVLYNEQQLTQEHANEIALIHKELEEQYAELDAMNEELIATNAELDEMNQALVNKNEEMDRLYAAQKRFLSMMGHELRNPLNGVMGFNQMLVNQGGLSEEQMGYAQSALESSKTLMELINDILDYSKMDAKKLSIRPVSYTVEPLFTQTIHTFKAMSENKGLSLSLEYGMLAHTQLVGDELRIRQILNNLISNALKYTSQGGVTVRVYEENSAITFEGKPTTNLVFEIADTGQGISPEGIKVLFIPYTRLNEEENRYIQGTGLGLNIVKNLVDLMGGEITVESEVGKGSTFRVVLTQEIDQTQTLPGHENKISFTGEILCVDDMPLNLRLIKGLLKDTNLQVELSSSGKDCLEKMRSKKYDLVFLDQMMPEMTGMETLARIKEARKNSDYPNVYTPIVALTANSGEDARKDALALGFDDYLSKPTTIENLQKVIERNVSGGAS